MQTYNWAGAVQSGTNFTDITTTVTIPTIYIDPNQWTTGLAIGVTLDGYTSCPGNFLFAGIIAAATPGYQSDFQAIWKWSGGGTEGLENQVDFPLKAHHKVRISVVQHSATRYNATVENLTTGQAKWRWMENSTPLTGCTASWTVQDYMSMLEWMPFANFTTPIVFEETEAVQGSGAIASAEGAQVVYIERPETGLMTSCSIAAGGVVTCLRV